MEKNRRADTKSAFQANRRSETDLLDVSLATPGLIQEFDMSKTRVGSEKSSLGGMSVSADPSADVYDSFENAERGSPADESETDDWLRPHVSRRLSSKTPTEEVLLEPEEEDQESLDQQADVIGGSALERDPARSDSSRILQIIRPNGHWNKRLIYGVLGVVLVFVIFGLGGGSKNKKVC